MRGRTALSCVGIILALGLAARAQEPISIKRVFKQGETDRYTTTIKFEQNDTEAVVVTTEMTREVKEDGTAIVATTVESIVLRARGSEMPFPGGSGQVILSTYDASGKLVKQEAVGGGGVAQLLNVARPTVAVQRPMKVGETVEEEVPLPTDKTRKARVTVTLQAVEPKSAEVPEEALRFKVVTETPVVGAEKGTVNRSTVTLRIARSNGKLIGAEGTMEGIPLPTGGVTRITFKVTRAQQPKPGS